MERNHLRLIRPTDTLDDMVDPVEEDVNQGSPLRSRRNVLGLLATLGVAGAGYALMGPIGENNDNLEAARTNQVIGKAMKRLLNSGSYQYLKDFEKALNDSSIVDPKKLNFSTRTNKEGYVDGIGVIFSPTGEKGNTLKIDINEPGLTYPRTHIGTLMHIDRIAGISAGVIDPSKPSYSDQLVRAANLITLSDSLRNQPFIEESKGLYTKDLFDKDGFRLRAELDLRAGLYGIGMVFPDEGPHFFTPKPSFTYKVQST